MRQAAEPVPESRQRILNAAIKLMSERGYAGTSISMIVKESGLPASSTYWHFGSKERLLAAVIDQAATEYLRDAPRLEDLEGEPRERFKASLSPSLRRKSGGPDFLRLLFLIALEQGDPDGEAMSTIRRVRETVKNRYRDGFRSIYGEVTRVETARFVDDLAIFALAVADGMFLASQIEPRKVDRGKILSMMADAFLSAADAFVASQAIPPRRRKRSSS